MTLDVDGRCMCTFCRYNKAVGNKIRWIVKMEAKGGRTRQQAAFDRVRNKLLVELSKK